MHAQIEGRRSRVSLADADTLPVRHLRLWDTTAVWPLINTASGVYSWTELDAWLLEAQSAGVDVMFTFGRTPQWASSDPTASCNYGMIGCAAPPVDVDTTNAILKAFVTALGSHSLASTTVRIKYYEIWNEPDVMGTWTGTAAQLVTIGKDIASIVHAMDPSALVIGPSPSSGNASGIHFLPAYYAAGGAPNQDIVGMHAYVYDGSTWATTPEGIQVIIDQLRMLMSTYAISNEPIVFTEGSWGEDGSLTSDEEVAYLGREYMFMWMNDIRRYYWYAWDSSIWGTLFEGSIEPAGTAYGRMEDWLVGSSHGATPCTQAADATWTCVLAQMGGAPAEILWNPDESVGISVGSTFAHYQTLRNATANDITAGTVMVGPEPILVTK